MSEQRVIRFAPDFEGHMLPAQDGRWVRYESYESVLQDSWPNHDAVKGLIMPGFADRMERMGASKDLVDFTRRLEVRHSEADLDAAFRNGMLAGWIFVGVGGVLLLLVSQVIK